MNTLKFVKVATIFVIVWKCFKVMISLGNGKLKAIKNIIKNPIITISATPR
jgi:hypothetical protein